MRNCTSNFSYNFPTNCDSVTGKCDYGKMKPKIAVFLARSLFDFPSNLISDFFFLLSLVLIHKYLRTFHDLFDIRFYTFTIHLLFNKLTSVFYASVLLLMINCIITLSVAVEPRAAGKWFRSVSDGVRRLVLFKQC